MDTYLFHVAIPIGGLNECTLGRKISVSAAETPTPLHKNCLGLSPVWVRINKFSIYSFFVLMPAWKVFPLSFQLFTRISVPFNWIMTPWLPQCEKHFRPIILPFLSTFFGFRMFLGVKFFFFPRTFKRNANFRAAFEGHLLLILLSKEWQDDKSFVYCIIVTKSRIGNCAAYFVFFFTKFIFLRKKMKDACACICG